LVLAGVVVVVGVFFWVTCPKEEDGDGEGLGTENGSGAQQREAVGGP
jgi:hypothetical protein